MPGNLLGKLISEEFPHIALIMLTSTGDDKEKFHLCKEIMTLGFSDFIEKDKFNNEAAINKHLNEVINLPSVLAKQHLKRKLSDFRYAIEHALVEADEAQKELF